MSAFWVYSWNKRRTKVAAVGSFRIILKLGHVLDLNNILIFQILVEIWFQYLDWLWKVIVFYLKKCWLFSSIKFLLVQELIDCLFKIDFKSDFQHNYLYLHTIGVEWNLMNENSSLLWCKRLKRISIERM